VEGIMILRINKTDAFQRLDRRGRRLDTGSSWAAMNRPPPALAREMGEAEPEDLQQPYRPARCATEASTALVSQSGQVVTDVQRRVCLRSYAGWRPLWMG
jgi:hypothetical protein